VALLGVIVLLAGVFGVWGERSGARGAEAWQLWRGNALLGAVEVKDTPGGTLVPLDALASAAGYSGGPGEEVYLLEQGGRRVEFVARAPVARVDGRLYPLSAPVSPEGERWWVGARGALGVLNGAEGKKGARGLRWGGVVEGYAPSPLPPIPSSPPLSPAPEGGEPRSTAPLGTGDAAEAVQVQRLRWGRQAEGLRVVFDLSGPPTVTWEKAPHKLVMTLVGVLPRGAEGGTSPFKDSVDLAVAQMGSRLVCTFSHRASAVKSLVLTDPHRLVIDFIEGEIPGGPSPGGGSEGLLASKPLPEPPPEEGSPEELRIPTSVAEDLASPGDPALPETPAAPDPAKKGPAPSSGGSILPSPERVLAGKAPPPERRSSGPKGKGLVVVDAGHGGKDPGAQGNGLREKELNLKVALNLAERLKKKGFTVRLTRDSDFYLKLKERTDLANTADADLFISVHTNALPKGRHARGVEIYIMALPTDKDAMDLALFENRELAEDASASHAAADKRTQLLLKILGDMQQNAKISHSMEFAEVLFSSGKKQGLNMRRIAQAPFFVLRGAGMPAVLVEMGYITEGSDAKLLASQGFQDRMAEALAQGAADYLNP